MAGVWMWQMKWIGDFGEISIGLLMRKSGECYDRGDMGELGDLAERRHV